MKQQDVLRIQKFVIKWKIYNFLLTFHYTVMFIIKYIPAKLKGIIGYFPQGAS